MSPLEVLAIGAVAYLLLGLLAMVVGRRLRAMQPRDPNEGPRR